MSKQHVRRLVVHLGQLEVGEGQVTVGMIDPIAESLYAANLSLSLKLEAPSFTFRCSDALPLHPALTIFLGNKLAQ